MKQNKQIFITPPLKSYRHNWNHSTGRNNKGHITAWHRGGGHSRLYREIDLKRKSTHGIVIGLEYDPNRTAFLARIFNPDTNCLLYTSPSPRDATLSRMPSSA